MLQPFVRASQLLKGGGKGKKGGLLLGGLELSSEETGLLNRNTQMLLRHLSHTPPHPAEQTGGGGGGGGGGGSGGGRGGGGGGEGHRVGVWRCR